MELDGEAVVDTVMDAPARVEAIEPDETPA
jgi:hypothetical protein